MRRRTLGRGLAFAGGCALLAGGALLQVDARGWGRRHWWPYVIQLTGGRSVEAVVQSLGAPARARLRPHFERAGLAYPPGAVTLLAFKQERVMELWAEPAGTGERRPGPRYVRSYEVLAASGGPGPKLREGDLQVPEGRYRVLWLNPNSSYHLSLRLDYPNAFDRERARRDGRTKLGGDIFIHGRAASIGCLAMGDPAVEELFVLAQDVGVARLTVLIAPVDFRARELDAALAPRDLPWLEELYAGLRRELQRYPAEVPR